MCVCQSWASRISVLNVFFASIYTNVTICWKPLRIVRSRCANGEKQLFVAFTKRSVYFIVIEKTPKSKRILHSIYSGMVEHFRQFFLSLLFQSSSSRQFLLILMLFHWVVALIVLLVVEQTYHIRLIEYFRTALKSY